MKHINDIEIYKQRMAMTMTHEEKLFFLDKIDLLTYDTIIDFGGADGALLHAVQTERPDVAEKCRFIIVDNDPQMEIAYELKNCTRVSSLAELTDIDGRVLVILSSVLHELDKRTMFSLIGFCLCKAQTIAIRDMFYFHLDLSHPKVGKKKDRKYYKQFFTNKEDRTRFEEMIPLCQEWYQGVDMALVHYILKCDYVENWESEKEENYFNRNVDTFVYSVTQNIHFYTAYRREYALPYKKQQARERFNLDLPNTHVQIILERRKIYE